jgi:hypothetical protein
MSAAAVSRRIGGFVARQRSVTVDVLAPGGRPAAATARFRLGLGAWDRDLAQRLGVMRITGRLFLTPAGRRWEIFGFRVAEDRPRALLPEKKTAAQKKVTQKKAARKRATEKKKASRKAAATRQKRGRR